MINGGRECLVTLMNWDALFFSHKKMRRILHLKIKQPDYVLSWLLVSADKITVTEKFCANCCAKSFPWITGPFHVVVLISDRKVHMTVFRPVVSKINPAHTEHSLLKGTRRKLEICTTNVLILYISPHIFLWPEEGPQWPKHVVSLINRIQRQLCFEVPNPC